MPTKHIKVNSKIHQKAKVKAAKEVKSLQTYTEEALTEKMQAKANSGVSEDK